MVMFMLMIAIQKLQLNDLIFFISMGILATFILFLLNYFLDVSDE